MFLSEAVSEVRALVREFRLSSPDSGRGIWCDASGAFISNVSLLRRMEISGEDRWEPRDCDEISEQLGLEFGLPIDISKKAGGLKAICNALNEGDVARAQIATVLLAIPEPPDLAKSAHFESDMIDFIHDLHWSGLIKRDWDPSKHPHWPAGSPEKQGGEFAPIWEAIGAVVDAIERTKELEINNDIATGRVGASAIFDGLRAYANYRAQPWIGRDGVPVRVLDIDFSGDPRVDAAAIWGHELAEPNKPLTRPATNADWIDPLMGAASVASLGAGPIFGTAAEGTAAIADTSEVAAPFIILRSELPADFDMTLPIGRFVPKTDLPPVLFGQDAHQQIGQLFRDALGTDMKLILRTAPGQTGIDVEVPSESVDAVGFQFGEIKFMSARGYSDFNSQITRWKLPAPVQAIVYDWQGNIYYGFVGPW